MLQNLTPLVKTIKERCRICYTCIRECPAKAIRVANGQAEVLDERCIGCGNCIKVCSQNAKEYQSSYEAVLDLLDNNKKTVACIAPSFPAEFTDMTHQEFVGSLRAIGFDYVVEVAFGADLVAKSYKEFIQKNPNKRIISSPCPAIVSFIEKYHPELVQNLANIMSPMLATARAVRYLYAEDLSIIFVGPCLAKKNEAEKFKDVEKIDAVITFAELRNIFRQKNIEKHTEQKSDFDWPQPGRSTIFPIGGGLLEAADLEQDLIFNNIVSTEGTKDFTEVIKEFSTNDISVKLLDVLCCEGCIMGSGFTVQSSKYVRHAKIREFATQRYRQIDQEKYRENINMCCGLDLSINFRKDDKRINIPSPTVIKKILKNMGKNEPEDELNCGACGYATCEKHAIAIYKGLAENEMCLPFVIKQVKEKARELSKSYSQLEQTQQALIQAEKLASMGQLAAGIAHEINNPLGIILLYAHLLNDKHHNDNLMAKDLQMIVEQADRCKNIVGGLLNFARKNKVIFKKADIIQLINKCLKAIKTPGSIEIINTCRQEEIFADVDMEQIMQVFINLFTNAIEAMPEGGKLHINARNQENTILIEINDTGIGIKEELKGKIYEPFFTTKQIGKGTGLGLAVTYGIIKMHRGNITITSNTDPAKGQTGTTFHINLPIVQFEN